MGRGITGAGLVAERARPPTGTTVPFDRVGPCMVLATLSNRPVPLTDDAVSNLLIPEAVMLAAVWNLLPELVVLSERNEGMLGIDERGGRSPAGLLGDSDRVEAEDADSIVRGMARLSTVDGARYGEKAVSCCDVGRSEISEGAAALVYSSKSATEAVRRSDELRLAVISRCASDGESMSRPYDPIELSSMERAQPPE